MVYEDREKCCFCCYVLKCTSPRTYRGQSCQSISAPHIILISRPSLLCISDLEGSSRRTLLISVKNTKLNFELKSFPPVHHNDFLAEKEQLVLVASNARSHRSPFGEPSLWPIPGFGLRRTRWHHKERGKPNHQGENTFQEEQVSPPCVSAYTAQTENTGSEESTANIGYVV